MTIYKARQQNCTNFHNARLIVEFVKFIRQELEENELDPYLASALESNLYVPDVLSSNAEVPPSPTDGICSGGPEEAIELTRSLKEVWDRTKGLSKWLESTKTRGGCKHSTNRKLFDILGKHVILIVLRDGRTLRVTPEQSITSKASQ